MFGHTNFVQSLHLPLPAMSNPTSARTSATFSESVMASEAQIISNTSLDQPTPKRLVEYDCSNNDAPATSRQAALAPSETRIHPFRTEPWPWMWWVLRWYLPWLHPGPLDAPMKTHMESLKTAISKDGNHLSSVTLFSVVPCYKYSSRKAIGQSCH